MVVTSINWLCTIVVGYYIATGVIIGCMVFAAVVLAIIVVCCCYVCKENNEKITIDDSEVIFILQELLHLVATTFYLYVYVGFNYWNT